MLSKLFVIAALFGMLQHLHRTSVIASETVFPFPDIVQMDKCGLVTLVLENDPFFVRNF